MPFKKGVSGNKSGKTKGSANKTTKSARELFVSIMECEVNNIKLSLEKVRNKNPEAYLNILAKFCPYFIPKKVDINSDDKLMQAPIIELNK